MRLYYRSDDHIVSAIERILRYLTGPREKIRIGHNASSPVGIGAQESRVTHVDRPACVAPVDIDAESLLDRVRIGLDQQIAAGVVQKAQIAAVWRHDRVHARRRPIPRQRMGVRMSFEEI